jgi:hypothetical protein
MFIFKLNVTPMPNKSTRISASPSALLGTYILAVSVPCNNNPVPGGYNWATLFLGDINTGTWPSRLGESDETVKYGCEFCGTSTQE